MVQKFVFTGAESSGKTTLCRALARQYGLPFVSEFARDYLMSKPDFSYVLADLSAIAAGQWADENRLLTDDAVQKAGFLLCDTDILTIKIWAEVVFGHCPADIGAALTAAVPTHYFLCHYADVPWEPDPLRENPTDRDRIFDIYVKNLDFLGKNYTILRGGLPERLAEAQRIVAQVLSKKSQTPS